MSILQTDRFYLVPATIEFIRLLVAKDYLAAGNSLNVVVPIGWPYHPDAIDGLGWHLRNLQQNPLEFLWRIRLIVLKLNETVIGSINLKGFPDENGVIEIGWGVSPEYQRLGIATQAAQLVMDWAWKQPTVKQIIATIQPDNIASIKVAEHLGMHLTDKEKRDLPMWVIE